MRQYPSGVGRFIRSKPNGLRGDVVTHNNFADRMASAGDGSFKFLPYQLSTGRVLAYQWL
jgi:hypothetical protein